MSFIILVGKFALKTFFFPRSSTRAFFFSGEKFFENPKITTH